MGKLKGHFRQFYHHIEINYSFFYTTYQYWLRILLMHNLATMLQHPRWQQIHKVTDAPSTVIHMWKFHRQKLITTAHLLTSKWTTTRKVTSHAELWFHKPDTWLTHACARGHSALTSESSGKYQGDDVASATQNLLTKFGKTTNMSSILMPADQPAFISGG